jgi:hypothetical protein
VTAWADPEPESDPEREREAAQLDGAVDERGEALQLRDAVQRELGLDVPVANAALPFEQHFRAPGNLDRALRDAGLANVTVERFRYAWTAPVEDFVLGAEWGARGRYLHAAVGDASWRALHDASVAAITERFGHEVRSVNEAWVGVGAVPA